jgi:hypothetical protein
MSKTEMIEDIETLIKANKDDDNVGFHQLGDMIFVKLQQMKIYGED